MALSSRISRDELVVLQLLGEIQRLVELAGGETKEGEVINPRMHPAAKLYLDTRDTFEVIEELVEEHVKGKPKLLRKLSKQLSNTDVTVSSALTSPRTALAIQVSNEAAIDRIQEMFRRLGSLLGPSILKELRLRKLSMTSILHYVRFLPMEFQWTAYKDARKEEVELVYRETVYNSLATLPSVPHSTPQTDTQTLRQRADFVKHQIRKDVDTVCLFAADGTLTTIFGDDGASVEENVAIKFESLIADVYSNYLKETLDVQMKHLTQVSDQWGHDNAIASAGLKHIPDTGPPLLVQCFYRPRKFRSKGGIFPDMLMNLVNRFVHLPAVHPGQQAKLLVVDPRHVGVWWQKSVFSVSERDVTTLHDDESRDIFGRVETLDGQLYVPLLGKGGEQDGSRLFGRSGGLAKWVGQLVLVNNGKDSVWVEVVVVDVDDKRCKLQIRKSLQKCAEIVSWTQFLSLNEWVNMRELRFIGAPVNPHFRVHMGLKFREILESVQAVVVEISSVFPNGELNGKVGNALWKSVETSISKGEHIFARYFRSILQQDVLTQVHPTVYATPTRSLSLSRSSSLGNVFSGQDNVPQSVLDQMFSSRGASQTAKGKRKAMIDIRMICLRLLVHLAIRSGPASIVLDAMSKKAQAGSFEQFAGVDTISELEYHVVSILDSVDPKGDVLGDFGIDESEKELWRIHTVFGGIELKKLGEVQLNWVALISRSGLPKQTLVGLLQHRHELGDWAYPVLTEEEMRAREQIQQFIDQVDNDTDREVQEDQDIGHSDQPANSSDIDNNSQAPEMGDIISETSDTRSLNWPT
ncbi:hypothetical protein PF008_g10107 [Phytophthora fragariae]|uniref:Uncharacterized protein n=1 Tax=Phytophthora fragariae TaxID=53985 RepID=A0A6G0RV88_9STRA|nr:hypothetical protein PF008_g10107 [Phytophthora fragariae]